MAKMLPKPPRPRDRGYLVSPTSRQLDSSRTSIGGGPLPMPMSRRGTAKSVNSQQRTSLGAGLVNTKKEVVTAKPQPKPQPTSVQNVQHTGRYRRPQRTSDRQPQTTGRYRRPQRTSDRQPQTTGRYRRPQR